jgi:hypothetical protein
MHIVSAYRPCQSDGTGGVFQQHRRALSVLGDHCDPLDAFIQDLQDDIAQWKEAGDHLILGMDANEDVQSGSVASSFSALGLQEAILDLHSD